MVRTCSKRGDIRNVHKTVVGKAEEKRRELGRIILRYMLKE
jgi:hypothetical protein